MSDYKKNVLLMHAAPELTSFQPLSVLSLAARLQDKGYNPIIFDSAVESFEELKKRVNFDELLCLGVSSWSGPQIKKGIEASKYVKKNNKDVLVVWGGIHASLLPEQTVESDYVDVVVRGEGDEAFLEILSNIKNLRDIKGIVYKEGGKIKRNPDRDFMKLTQQEVSSYELLNLKKYGFGDVLYYITSKGCPYGCIFCYNLAFNKRKWRAKSPELVLSDLDYLVKKFNPRYVVFSEDNFFVDFGRAEKIMRGFIEKGFKFKWHTTCRADYLCKFDDSYLKLISESGCKSFNVGGESGSPRILELIKKQITPEQIILSAKKCKKHGIDAIYSFMAGVPSETKEEQEVTFKLIQKLWDMDVPVNGYFISTAVPGTPLFEMIKKYNIELPDSLEGWSTWQAYVDDEKGTPWLTAKHRSDLMLYSEIVRFFYIIRNLRNLGNKKGLKRLLLSFFKYLVCPLLSFSFSLRWRFRITALPIDMKLWLLAKKKYVGYY
ncbi:MAG: B12-binding domain-containing radical SAM protein [Candidatus Saganbacteria bacterium]|nr:B12-binding domain-containing radical SAM protein [Candidatus Saganbacteria bacterium]